MNLQTAVDLFLGEYKTSTQKSYKYVLRDFVGYIDPTRHLTDITTSECVAYMQRIDKRPTITSDKTYDKYVQTLQTFFNRLIEWDIIDKSPANALKRRWRAKRIPKTRAMPDDAYNKLIRYAKAQAEFEEDYRPLMMLLFLGDTGCRIGELANLQWKDIDLTLREANVSGKTAPYMVTFGDACKTTLIQWRDNQWQGGEGHYIAQINGRKMNNDDLGQYFRRVSRRAKAYQDNGCAWGPHSLRHRKGHQHADKGTPPSLTAKILGHADPAVTVRAYYPDDWAEAKRHAQSAHYKEEQQPPTDESKIRRLPKSS